MECSELLSSIVVKCGSSAVACWWLHQIMSAVLSEGCSECHSLGCAGVVRVAACTTTWRQHQTCNAVPSETLDMISGCSRDVLGCQNGSRLCKHGRARQVLDLVHMCCLTLHSFKHNLAPCSQGGTRTHNTNTNNTLTQCRATHNTS